MHKLALVTKARRFAVVITRDLPSVGDYGYVAEDHFDDTQPPRLLFPEVVWYLVDGDRLQPIPPTQHDLTWRPIVLNLTAYDRLARSGALYSPEHTGRARNPMVDNRKAPG